MRPMDPGDVGFVVDLHRQPHVRDLLFAPKAEHVQRALANSSVEHHIVLDVETPVGLLILAQVVPAWLFEIRHMISKHESRGIGSFAMAWALERIFENGRAHRVYLEVHARNVRARTLYERFGFALEGTYRDGAQNPISKAYEDLCFYGMLEQDYRHHREPAQRSTMKGDLP